MESITPLQFWLGVLTMLAPQLYSMYARWKDSKDKVAELNSLEKVKDKEINADDELKRTEAWERLSQEYARQIESLKKLEVENGQLRPLVLKLALQEQDMKQTRDDKEDWKRYANKLYGQLEAFGQVPLPFRRTPSDSDTSERMKAISKKIKTVQGEVATNRESPTTIADNAQKDKQ